MFRLAAVLGADSVCATQLLDMGDRTDKQLLAGSPADDPLFGVQRPLTRPGGMLC